MRVSAARPSEEETAKLAAMEKAEEIHPSEKNSEIFGASSLPTTPDKSEEHPGIALGDDVHIDLSWRSWVVVFVSCFAYVPFFFHVGDRSSGLIHE